jgi:hypothetical protein
MMRHFMVMIGFLLLTNCASKPTSQQLGEASVDAVQGKKPEKSAVIIGSTVKQAGYGYAIEIMPAWRGLASGTPGQEKVFIITHPDLPTRYGRADVMNVVFVNRFSATPETMVDLFLKRYPRAQIKTRKAIPDGYWLVTVDNRLGERNSLMFTRILFNAQTKQAISYSLNMQVTGDVEAMRSSSDVDGVAEALLNLFYLEPLA